MIKIPNSISQTVHRDIRELEDKIQRFKTGEMPEEKFRAYRLTRGVYGQRQLGVQMLRIKIPFGRITADQLIRMADIAEKYTNGNLHATTRQNIQMHHIKVDDSPAIWVELEEAGITAREACGNTVRTITGSPQAGIDPNELFDISPYAHATSHYFLRNPISQEMGRKFKMAFSSSDSDSAFTYFHDLGFIPRIRTKENGEIERGFKVVIGGGLGAQPFFAQPIYEFLEADKIIPLTEAVIRVFDRYGEREKRYKARMKFLINDKRGLGLEKFMELVEEEKLTLKNKTFKVNDALFQAINHDEKMPNGYTPSGVILAASRTILPDTSNLDSIEIQNKEKYNKWLITNTFEQKQKGFYAVQIRLPLGNILAPKARKFADIVKKYAADDIRITVNQGFLLRFVSAEALPHIYQALDQIDLANPGFDSISDITACPGSDTCNLAVTDSTNLTAVLEHLIDEDYPELVGNTDIKIKISGCMNACGQHMIGQIGFHGSSIKKAPYVIPAMQVVLGGGLDANGKGFIGEKVIKIPTKHTPAMVAHLLDNYLTERENENETFQAFYWRLGKKYFYSLLKPFANVDDIAEDIYFDWGKSAHFTPEIGVGECAGVMVDVIGSIITDANEKHDASKQALKAEQWADAIYNSYNAFVVGAKALLLSEDIKCNTQINILKDFNKHFVKTGKTHFNDDFVAYVLRLKNNEPDKIFAEKYYYDAAEFLGNVQAIRRLQIAKDTAQVDKTVIQEHYKA